MLAMSSKVIQGTIFSVKFRRKQGDNQFCPLEPFSGSWILLKRCQRTTNHLIIKAQRSEWKVASARGEERRRNKQKPHKYYDQCQLQNHMISSRCLPLSFFALPAVAALYSNRYTKQCLFTAEMGHNGTLTWFPFCFKMLPEEFICNLPISLKYHFNHSCRSNHTYQWSFLSSLVCRNRFVRHGELTRIFTTRLEG